jgi:phosphinothricin acetyltransferase
MTQPTDLKIRQAQREDGAAIARIYAPYAIGTAITFDEKPPTAGEMSRRIGWILNQYPYLVAQSGENVIGYCYATSHRLRASYRWSVDVGIYIDQSHHRSGVGTALYKTLLPLLRCQGYVMAYAGITLPNAASVGLHESIGFKPLTVYKNVGFKLGQWRDVGWWELALNDPPPNPKEPIPWSAMPEFESPNQPQQIRPEHEKPHDD